MLTALSLLFLLHSAVDRQLLVMGSNSAGAAASPKPEPVNEKTASNVVTSRPNSVVAAAKPAAVAGPATTAATAKARAATTATASASAAAGASLPPFDPMAGVTLHPPAAHEQFDNSFARFVIAMGDGLFEVVLPPLKEALALPNPPPPALPPRVAKWQTPEAKAHFAAAATAAVAATCPPAEGAARHQLRKRATFARPRLIPYPLHTDVPELLLTRARYLNNGLPQHPHYGTTFFLVDYSTFRLTSVQSVPYVHCAVVRHWLHSHVPVNRRYDMRPSNGFGAYDRAPPDRLLSTVFVHAQHSVRRTDLLPANSGREKRPPLHNRAAAAPPLAGVLWRCDRGTCSQPARLTLIPARVYSSVPIPVGDAKGLRDDSGVLQYLASRAAHQLGEAPARLGDPMQDGGADDVLPVLLSRSPLSLDVARIVASYCASPPSFLWFATACLPLVRCVAWLTALDT
jgi:hypothetical protein